MGTLMHRSCVPGGTSTIAAVGLLWRHRPDRTFAVAESHVRAYGAGAAAGNAVNPAATSPLFRLPQDDMTG